MRFILRIIVVLLMGGVGLASGARADDQEDCRRYNPDVRIAACSRLIAKGGVDNKELARLYGLRALAHASKTARDKANADYDEAIRLDPNSAATHYYRGLKIGWQDRDAGLAELEAAIRLDTSDGRFFSARGNLLGRKGEFDRAMADAETAVRLDPAFAPARQNFGMAYVRKNDFDRAIAEFDAVIKIDPTFVWAYIERGNALREKREYERSIVDYDFVLRQEPANVVAYVGRGRAYSEKGDNDRAFADYSVAIRLDPSHAHAYNNRGNIHRARKENDRARSDYDVAIRLAPSYAVAYSNRSALLKDMGEVDAAIADLQKVLELPATAPADKQRQDVARDRIARLKQQARPSTQLNVVSPAPFKRVALIIGNGKYEHAGVLANPVNDAAAITAALRRLEFDVVEVRDANREVMGKAIKDLGDRANGAEWAVLFFAGHGIEVNGTTYLIPTDAALKRDNHVEDEAISLNRVQAKVDGATKLGLVILDSCRNNPFLSRMVRSAGATRSMGNLGGLAPVEPEGNVLIAYSAKHGTVAEDGKGLNSPFTEALLAHMEQPGLEVNLLLRKVRDEVRRKTDRRQEPFHYGSLSSEQLYFRGMTR